jgi:predicted Zn-dependent protease
LETHKNLNFFDAGITPQRRGDCEWADTITTRALAVEGKVGNSNLRLGECYEKQGKHREALQAYARELKINPHNSRINLLMGRMNIASGRYASAYAQLQQVAADEQGAAYHYMMAEVLEAQNDKTAARQHHAEAVALSGSPEAAAESVLQLTVK